MHKIEVLNNEKCEIIKTLREKMNVTFTPVGKTQNQTHMKNQQLQMLMMKVNLSVWKEEPYIRQLHGSWRWLNKVLHYWRHKPVIEKWFVQTSKTWKLENQQKSNSLHQAKLRLSIEPTKKLKQQSPG